MNWVLLTKLPDLIQRDALVYHLGQQQVEVMTPDRDMIVNVGGGPNLTLGGYSAMFDGYSVLVQKKDLLKAQDVLTDFEPLHLQISTEVPDYMSKYYYSSVLSVFAPFILHITAIYHLFKAIQLGQFRFTLKFVMASIVSALSFTLVLYAILT
jgi:hypothetical protein